MREVNDFQFKVILQCEQDKFNPTRKQYCEYLVEMNGVERPLRDILKENIEQQATIEKQKRIIKSQDAEISRQYNLCLAMSGVLREEFGVYDVFDRTKDKKEDN